MPSRPPKKGSSSKVSVLSYETAHQLLQQFVAEGKNFTDSLKSKTEAEITETDYKQGDNCMRKIEGASNQAFTSHVSEVWRFGTLSHTDPALARYHYLAECASDAAKGFRKQTVPDLDFMSTLENDESKALISLNSLMARRVSSDSNGMARLLLNTLRTVTQGREAV